MCLFFHSWKRFRVKSIVAGLDEFEEYRRCRKCGGVQKQRKVNGKYMWMWSHGCWLLMPVFDTLEEAMTTIQ